MANQPTLTTLDSERPRISDIWEVARLPALFVVITAAATWLIWYYTNTPCTSELAARSTCNPAEIARYVNVDIFGRMLTYAAIAAAAGGVWNYNMFTKMRAVIAAEKHRADEAEKQLEEYRHQAAEERREMMQQNAELNRAVLAALTELTAELVRLRQERNGNGGREH